jgi:hypothetical protein
MDKCKLILTLKCAVNRMHDVTLIYVGWDEYIFNSNLKKFYVPEIMHRAPKVFLHQYSWNVAI